MIFGYDCVVVWSFDAFVCLCAWRERARIGADVRADEKAMRKNVKHHFGHVDVDGTKKEQTTKIWKLCTNALCEKL